MTQTIEKIAIIAGGLFILVIGIIFVSQVISQNINLY
jgi:hypothetical protein